MKFVWLTLCAIAALLIKENSCTPSVRRFSRAAISFPKDNWDDCFLDEESTQPGLCKTIEECPTVLSKWENENVYPKNCYFIKTEQFVCCPTEPAVDTPVEPDGESPVEPAGEPPVEPAIEVDGEPAVEPAGEPDLAPTFESDDEPIDKSVEFVQTRYTTKRHANIFLDKVQSNNIVYTTNIPSNIFLDKLNADKTTSENPSSVSSLPDVINTEKGSLIKRRTQTECELQNKRKFEAIDKTGPASEMKEFPFMAALGWKSSDDKVLYACAGVLISSKFLLTAAHCAGLEGESPKFVRLGDENLQDSQENTINIKRFIMHPEFNATTIYNDIALVELEEDVNKPTACLWTEQELPTNNLTALGYGHPSFESLNTNKLFKAALTVIDRPECKDYYNRDTADNENRHLCASDAVHSHSSCQGDTGGPLIMELYDISYVVGITMFGLRCVDSPPFIFTRVASFIDWIEPIVWPEIDVRFE